MKTFWKTIGSVALKLAIYAVGHTDVVVATVADAKSKNIPQVIADVVAIAQGTKGTN